MHFPCRADQQYHGVLKSVFPMLMLLLLLSSKKEKKKKNPLLTSTSGPKDLPKKPLRPVVVPALQRCSFEAAAAFYHSHQNVGNNDAISNTLLEVAYSARPRTFSRNGSRHWSSGYLGWLANLTVSSRASAVQTLGQDDGSPEIQ